MNDLTDRTRVLTLQPRADTTTGAFGEGSIAIRLRSEDTGGQFGLVEQVIPPGDEGPAMHVHPAFDETFYVVEGTIVLRVGDHGCDAGSGTVAFVPRGTPHTFANPTDQPARMLVLVTPGGFERYFEELLALIENGGRVPPTHELIALRIRHGSIPV